MIILFLIIILGLLAIFQIIFCGLFIAFSVISTFFCRGLYRIGIMMVLHWAIGKGLWGEKTQRRGQIKLLNRG